ncbi:PQQ-binding-like beta-propeller repeat protein (plasmid) [Haladaptatus sp. SPP-AMP-3]|uniref:outer membrane protein assembly factor BamB family protein n=1 Tax=Haladaptatus sp. SPP-AMP-3 TaxID=3121295 RepID=UPI003C307938
MNNNTRRTFLKGVGVTATALGIGGNIVLAEETDGTETDDPPAGWSLYRGTNGRTGATRMGGPTDAGNLDVIEWTNPDGSIGEPVVADDTVYLAVRESDGPGATAGFVAAYDLQTGTEKWKQTTPAPHTPTVGTDRVYFLTSAPESPDPDDGGVFALDIETGEVAWTRTDYVTYGQPVWTQPILADEGLLTTNVSTGSAYALDPATGDTVWKTGGVEGDVAYADGTVYTTDGTAVDASDGSKKWSVEGSIEMVADGSAYGTTEGTVHSWSVGDGASQWSTSIEGEFGQFALGDEQLLVVTEEENTHRATALDATSGKERWSVEPLSALSGLSVGDGIVYVGGRRAVDDGTDEAVVLAIDPASGEPTWSLRLPARTEQTDNFDGLTATTPVAVDGSLLVSSSPHDVDPFWYESDGYTRDEILYRITADESPADDDASGGDETDDEDSNGNESNGDESDADDSTDGSEDTDEETENDRCN